MRSIRRFSLLFCLTSLGCSGSAFDVANAEDAAEDAAETGATEDIGADASAETSADTSAPEDAGEDAQPDASEASVPEDTGRDAAVDSATDAADAADAADATDTADTAVCTPNACGGCSQLPYALGASCGACASGKYICDGLANVRCDDPVKTAAPGTACGTCGSSKFACSVDKQSTYCEKPNDVNACGGCAALTAVLGTTCGTCNFGVVECNGVEATKCTEPTITPGLPGAPCGKCSSGQYVCSTKPTTSCNDPVPSTDPAAGTACGTCGTSAYQCTGDKLHTACAKPDDRTKGYEVSSAALATYTAWTDKFSPPVRFGFTATHSNAQLVSIELYLRRQEIVGFCSGSSSSSCSERYCEYVCQGGCACVDSELGRNDAAIGIELHQGTVDAATPVIATVYANAAASGATVFNFSTLPTLTSGTSYWIKFINYSGSHIVELANSSDTVAPTAVYGEASTTAKIAVRIQENGCGF